MDWVNHLSNSGQPMMPLIRQSVEDSWELLAFLLFLGPGTADGLCTTFTNHCRAWPETMVSLNRMMNFHWSLASKIIIPWSFAAKRKMHAYWYRISSPRQLSPWCKWYSSNSDFPYFFKASCIKYKTGKLPEQ